MTRIATDHLYSCDPEVTIADLGLRISDSQPMQSTIRNLLAQKSEIEEAGMTPSDVPPRPMGSRPDDQVSLVLRREDAELLYHELSRGVRYSFGQAKCTRLWNLKAELERQMTFGHVPVTHPINESATG
jgi:hypothetical protein